MKTCFDKTSWKHVAFKDIAHHINRTISFFPDREFSRYIGLEHLDPDTLKINRWGDLNEGISFNKVFQTGQILFGKRRVYLRKAAIADFDGVCSGDILVFEPKTENIAPSFFPFIVQSDAFFTHAIKTSAGSLSPRTKWKDLAEFRFCLPPLDEQRRIAELLYKIEAAIEQTEQQEQALREYKQGVISHLFQENGSLGNLVQPHDVRLIPFANLAQHISKRVEPQETDLEIYVGLEHLDPKDLKIRRNGTPQDVKGTKLVVEPGDIIFGKRRAYQRKVAVADFHGICSAHAMVLRAKPEHVLSEFLPYLMQSDMFMNRAVQISEGSLSPTIKWKVLAQQPFYCPVLDKQQKIVDILKQFDQALEQTTQHKAALIALKKGLLNELIG